MEHFLNFLKQIAETYGITAATVILLLGGLLFAAYTLIRASPRLIEKYIDKRAEREAAKHAQANLRRKNIATEVSHTLSELIMNTKINRAILFEFSNGSSNLAGLPFLFVNATCECFSVGAISIAYAYQRINVSLFASFLLEIENAGHLYIKDPEEVKDRFPAVYNLLKEHKSGSSVFYAVYGVDQMLGILLLANKAGDTFTLCDVIADASEAAQKISGLLSLENWEDIVD